MSRIDIPTLRCDRCGGITQDQTEIDAYGSVQYEGAPRDLCPSCLAGFAAFMENQATETYVTQAPVEISGIDGKPIEL